MRKYIKIFINSIILLMALTTAGYADKWRSMTFSDDIADGFRELNHYCMLHDVKAEDVLWANGIASEDIKSGTVVYLPGNQIDMLSLWQNKGAWTPSALVPVTSAAAAKRAAQSKKSEPEPAPKAEIPKPLQLPQELFKPSQMELPEIKISQKKPDPKIKAESPEKLEKAEKEKVEKIIVQPEKKENPANVIASSAKPDKILTNKPKKTQPDIPGLMDPVIVLSPNGDPVHGPMRLVISGDNVEVVMLPQNAVPKRPSMADLDHTFGTTPDYLLPYYEMTAKSRKNNNYYYNMKNLNGKMMWPVDGKVSSFFGQRGSRRHEGIDIPMPSGTPIRAARNGVVLKTGNNSTPGFRGYGNFVLLDHGNGVQTFYAHCLSTNVREGQRIMQGQVIATVGNTGRSTANHLHFEVRVNNMKVNPIPYLAGNTHYASHK